ncbi:hypothetical protein MHU86_12447 [Fragilaria crotonensis]|nr:hypothetical protein MHU86_12447 [Fragilaria crotonensis]
MVYVHIVCSSSGSVGKGDCPRPCEWVGGVGASRVSCIEEGVVVDHVPAHLIGPLKDLWANVVEEGVGRPAPKYHDLGHWVVHEEEPHRSSRPDGSSSDIVRPVAERLAPSCAGRPQLPS